MTSLIEEARERKHKLMSAARKIAKALDALHSTSVLDDDEPIQRAITCLNNAEQHLHPLLFKKALTKKDEEDPV